MLNTLCMSDETEDKRGVGGIEKVERSRNWEMWNNSQKQSQRKQRTNADINSACFSQL